MTMVVAMILRSRGRTTNLSIWKPVAPSTLAASRTDSSMDRASARTSVVVYPAKSSHTSVTEGKAVPLSFSQLWVRLSRPIPRRMEFTTPYWGLKMFRKIMPTAALEMMLGIM